MTLAALTAIYFVHLAAAMSPGPAVLLAARTGLRDGFQRGIWLALGIGLGAVIWAAAALFGLALVFKIAPALLTTLKIAGAAYLLWLAYKMWRHAGDPMDEEIPDLPRTRSAPRLIWLGISTQLANPKPAVFFGTVFLTFIPPSAPAWAYAAILGIVMFNDAGWNVIVARIFSLEKTRAAYLNLKTVIERCFGGLLALLGLKLALS